MSVAVPLNEIRVSFVVASSRGSVIVTIGVRHRQVSLLVLVAEPTLPSESVTFAVIVCAPIAIMML